MIKKSVIIICNNDYIGKAIVSLKKFKRFIRNWDGKNNLIFVTHYVVIYEILGYAPSSGEIIISNKDLKVIDTIEIEY